MSSNIVTYLIETTNMTQRDIASKLKSLEKDKTGVSQALISKWKRGEKIPYDREIELLIIAGLFWELEYPDEAYHEGNEDLPNILMDPLIDSKWNVIVKSEKNQENWYNFFKDLLAPKQFVNVNSEYKDNDFVKFVRGCIFSLNDAGFEVPENSESVNNKNNSRFFNLLRRWMHRVTILQNWCSGSIPHRKFKDSSYTELYNQLPRIALSQIISNKDLPEKTDRVLSENFVEDTSQLVKSLIQSYMFWDDEGFLGDEDFNEILIPSKNDGNKTLNTSSSKASSNVIENVDDQYLSYSERIIIDRLNANEKLIQELHQKIDLLINQNDDTDGIPF